MERGYSHRLNFRIEGDLAMCYCAPLESMDGATLVSSMRRSLLQSVPGLWDAWRELMRTAMALATEEPIVVTIEQEGWQQ